MAESGGNDDVIIKVGAEADTKEASAKILAEFEAMRKKLSLVGTEEAQALAEQISSVAKGLKEGAVDPASVQEVAAAFSNIEKSSELSDRAISGFSSKLSDAVNKSRSLSDYMRDAAKESDDGGSGMDNIRDAISDISPEASRISSEVGKWANRLPGVHRIIQAMPKAAAGIGIVFSAIVASVLAFRNALREANSAMREARDRNFQIKDEKAGNAFANAKADIDLAAQERRRELEHKKAMLELDKKAQSLARERLHYALMAQAENEREREKKRRDFEREEEEKELRKEIARIEKDEEGVQGQLEDLDKKRIALAERIKAEQEQLAEAQRKEKEASSLRSTIKQDAEAMEMLREAGVDIDDESMWSRAMEVLGGKMSDWWQDTLAPFKGELTTEDAQAQYIGAQDRVRQSEQAITDLNRQMKEMENERKALTDAAKQLAGEKYNVSYNIDTNAARYQDEDNARRRAYEEHIGDLRTDSMKNSNRLTALGLGSGNAAIDVTKEISNTTKSILGEIRSFKGSKIEAFSPMGGTAKKASGRWALGNEIGGPMVGP